MSEPQQILLAKLREAMRDAELNQVGLAERSGLKQSHISEILSGAKNPGHKSLGAILHVFPHLRPQVMAYLDDAGRRRRGSDAA